LRLLRRRSDDLAVTNKGSPRGTFCLVTARGFLSCHCEECSDEAVSYFHSVSASSFPCHCAPFLRHCEFFSLSLQAPFSITASPFLVTASAAKQSRISTAFPQGERGRDCFANAKTSSQMTAQKAKRRDCFGSEKNDLAVTNKGAVASEAKQSDGILRRCERSEAISQTLSRV
jgi:hypothetical protein